MFTLFRRFWPIAIILFVAACQPAATPTPPAGTLPPVTEPGATETITGPATVTFPSVRVTPTAIATSSAPLVTPPPRPAITELALPAGGVVLHPMPVIYAGDWVTFQILAAVPGNIDPGQVQVDILVDGRRLASGPLDHRGFSDRAIGLFEWAWDTTEAAGTRQLHVILDPADQIQAGDSDPTDNVQALNVVVRPAAALSAHEAAARWLTVESGSARLHVISGSAAHRDLEMLAPLVEAAVDQAAARVGVRSVDMLDFYFIERVIGQGGYANSIVVISYLDRNYSGGGIREVLTHEAVHLLERQFVPDRFPFFSEGIAVWASDGHYQQEDLTERSAALVTIGRYVPLADMIDTFFLQQHEIAYLEAAGFVTFLVDRYGWTSVRAFYSSLRINAGESPAAAVDRHLRDRFGRGLAELEATWLARLEDTAVSAPAVADLRTTLRYYDLMRAYQQHFDPTAYFLEAWLPFPDEAVARGLGLTADFMRHPRTETNIILETMLTAADQAMRHEDALQANVLLDSVDRVLDRDGVIVDPLANTYRQLVRVVADLGLEAQQITVALPQASILARAPDKTELVLLEFMRQGQEWVWLR